MQINSFPNHVNIQQNGMRVKGLLVHVLFDQRVVKIILKKEHNCHNKICQSTFLLETLWGHLLKKILLPN